MSTLCPFVMACSTLKAQSISPKGILRKCVCVRKRGWGRVESREGRGQGL